MPRPEPPVFKSWLLFFPPVTVLGMLAEYYVMRRVLPEVNVLDAADVLTTVLVSVVVPAPLSLALFGWLVTPSFEPDPDPTRWRLPVFRPWLVYYAVSTVVCYLTSAVGGALVGAIVLQTGQQFDLADWRVVPLAVVFFVAPPSWIVFRWVVGRHYVPSPGGRPGNANSPG